MVSSRENDISILRTLISIASNVDDKRIFRNVRRSDIVVTTEQEDNFRICNILCTEFNA